MILISLVLVSQGLDASPKASADDIVVVARRNTCRMRFADRDLTKGEFKRRAAEWAAGRPVRVIARRSADLKCLTKIAFRLADRGVRRITFVEPADAGVATDWTPGTDPFTANREPAPKAGDHRPDS